jgi:hypothetical protein
MDHNELDSSISGLGERVTNMFIRKDGDFWKGAWSEVRRIGGSFKEVRYPTGSERQAAWERFQKIVEGMKQQREEHHRKNEERAEDSASVCREIESLGRMADPSAGAFEDFLLTISGIKPMAAAGRGVLEGAGLVASKDWVRERKNQLQELNKASKRAWEFFEDNTMRLIPQDRAKCFETLKEISDRIQKEWAEWKRVSGSAREERAAHFKNREAEFERKQDLKRRLIAEMQALDPTAKSAGDEAKALAANWKQIGFSGRDHEERLWADFRAASDSFWRRRKAGAGERLCAALEKQREFRSNLVESLERAQSNLSRFQGHRDTSRSDAHRAKMEEIIADIAAKAQSKLEKLSQVNASIEELERKIRDMQ